MRHEGRRLLAWRVPLPLFERFDNFPDAQHRIFHLVLGEVIEDAVKIIPHLRRQFDARHFQRASLRAAGRFTFFSARRFSR